MTKTQRAEIVRHFAERAKNFGLKPGTKRYLDAQAMFFCGAMAAAHHVAGEQVDPVWTISIMSGRDIVKDTAAA